MLLYVSPISGGFFPNQLELIALLCDLGIVPDVGMSTSGGNMAMYFAYLARWSRDTIMRDVLRLNDSFVVKPWSTGLLSTYLPVPLMGLLKGSLYDRGSTDPFASRAGEDLSTGTELWTTAFNKTQGKVTYFTNKRAGDTFLTRADRFANADRLRYVNGDYQRLRDICFASASVPGVQREVIIQSEAYIDGGVSYASPFQAFQSNLRDLADHEGEQIHIVYVHCCNLRTPAHEPRNDGILASTMHAVNILTEGHILSDVSAVLTFPLTLRSYHMPNPDGTQKKMHTQELVGTPANLALAMRRLSTYSVTVLELAPVFNRAIEYTSFTAEEMLSVMGMARDHFTIRMHWIA